MNKISFILFMSLVSVAKAVPILDSGVGTITPYAITIMPDDTERNLYYYFPQHYGLANLGQQKALNCTANPNRHSTQWSASCNMIFEASFSPDLQKKMNEIKAANPAARFATPSMNRMSISATTETSPYLKSANCQKIGSQIGQQMSCTWIVQPGRFELFRKNLKTNSLVQVMQFSTQYLAVSDRQRIQVPFAIPMYVSDLGQGPYFFDSNGNVVQ